MEFAYTTKELFFAFAHIYMADGAEWVFKKLSDDERARHFREFSVDEVCIRQTYEEFLDEMRKKLLNLRLAEEEKIKVP